MQIPEFDEIIEQNDQTEARKASLKAIGELVGNVYTNKFARSTVSGGEDTISALKHCDKVADVEARMSTIKANLAEGERPPADKKDALNEELKALGTVRIAGRLTTPTRGNFVHLTDGMSKLQVYCNKKGPLALVKNDGGDTLDEENGWALWQLLDHGDFVGVEGYLFVTNTGEVSVHVERLQFLAKAMLPMPDKMHGVEDAEIKQRQRYLDLIASSLKVEGHGSEAEADESAIRNPQSAMTTREVFETRAKIISSMRHYLEDHGYIEVETPMLTPKATGAAAKPFKTHHNALDIDLYARIAPELYLKRLVVGGFEKVYELNRNFRNEGISYKHNPEFTMLEFYCAYMDVNGMMDFCKDLLLTAVKAIQPDLKVPYGEGMVDFGRTEQMSMTSAVAEHWDSRLRMLGDDVFDSAWLDDILILRRCVAFFNLFSTAVKDPNPYFGAQTLESLANKSQANRKEAAYLHKDDLWRKAERYVSSVVSDEQARESGIPIDAHYLTNQLLEFLGDSKELLIHFIFEESTESLITDPVFVTDYPKSISPLSKASPENPNIAERFELFINGMEVANGFSELNDPREQYERFVDQTKQREGGDEEAMILDEDYIRALSYGMPPAAGIGIGIDRLVMLLTNKHSIRDVILFPHMRPERNSATEDTEVTEKE